MDAATATTSSGDDDVAVEDTAHTGKEDDDYSYDGEGYGDV